MRGHHSKAKSRLYSKSKLYPICAVAVIVLFVGIAITYAFCLPRRLFPAPLSTVVLSSSGELIGARIAADGQWRFPVGDSVPEKFARALLCYEDRRFYYHPGLDPFAIARSIRLNLIRGRVVSGASTLDMQVIRLSRSGRPRRLTEKIKEAIMATRLNLRFSKQEILALYAANAPFGGNVVGVEAAAYRYFGRPATDLSWAESAMLAVLPNSPSLVHLARNRDLLLEKRNSLILEMEKRGIIDSQTARLSTLEPLPIKPCPMPDLAYHFTELMRKKSGGGLIHSTLDANLQKRINSLAHRYNNLHHSNGIDNMAILVADVNSGSIVAYFGNNASQRNGKVDMIMAPRSSGSTLKPFLYASMIDRRDITPTQLIRDTPFSDRNFRPQNYNRQWDGAVPANEVIIRSLNVPSVRMLRQYGIERFLLQLRGLGFSTLPFGEDYYGLSLILGGGEITLMDLCHAYYLLSAKTLQFSYPDFDIYQAFNYQITSSDAVSAQKVASSGTLSAQQIPISAAAAWITLETISQLSRPEEEGLWQQFTSSGQIAWKTGTSWGNRDAWAVGASTNYIVGVWVGNSDGEGRSGLTGVGYAAPVMFDVWGLLPSSGRFPEPEADMESLWLCAKSGHPAGMYCPDSVLVKIPRRKEMGAIEGDAELCPYHILLHLSPDLKYRVNSTCCPVSQMKEQTWFTLPPAMEWYYMRKHPEYKTLPPLHPAMRQSAASPIEIIYPRDGTIIIPTTALDGHSKGAIIRAVHTDPQASLFWHIDNKYIGCTTASPSDHRLVINTTPGNHSLMVMDSNGNSAQVNFTSK